MAVDDNDDEDDDVVLVEGGAESDRPITASTEDSGGVEEVQADGTPMRDAEVRVEGEAAPAGVEEVAASSAAPERPATAATSVTSARLGTPSHGGGHEMARIFR